jgi:hypothetical protein
MKCVDATSREPGRAISPNKATARMLGGEWRGVGAVALADRGAPVPAVAKHVLELSLGADRAELLEQGEAAGRLAGGGGELEDAGGADLVLYVEIWLDLPRLRGLAVLLREDGIRMAVELGAVMKVEPRSQKELVAEAAEARSRLAAAGFVLKEGLDADALLRLRQDHAGWVEALADHLGRSPAPLVPARV